MISTLEHLALRRFQYERYTLDAEGAHFAFYLEHDDVFFRLRREMVLANDRALPRALYLTPKELVAPSWLQSFCVRDVLQTIGLRTSYEPFTSGRTHVVKPEHLARFIEAYGDRAAYRRLADLLDIPANRKNKLETQSEAVTTLNHILRKFTCAQLDRRGSKRARNDDGAFVREYAYTQEKPFDANIMYFAREPARVRVCDVVSSYDDIAVLEDASGQTTDVHLEDED